MLQKSWTASVLSACLTTTINLLHKPLGLWCPFFPDQSLFLSAHNFLCFMQLICISSIDLLSFVVWSIPERQSSYVDIELIPYLKVWCMVSIVCVIVPGKIGLMYKIHFVNEYITATVLHADIVAIDDQVCFSICWIPGCPSHPVTWDYSLTSPLSSSVVWHPFAASLAQTLAKLFY